MTQRGGGGTIIPTRPVTPPAPDSLSVPEKKLFTAVQSVGSGAAADIRSQVRSLGDLRRTLGVNPTTEGAWYQSLLQEVEFHAEPCHHDEGEPTNDPTWGFRVFVTS